MRDIRHQESGERSIRNISLGRRPTRHPAGADHVDDMSDGPSDLPPRRRRVRRSRLWIWGLGVVIVCAVLGLLLSTVFAGATVTIHPRTATVTLPATLQAQQNAPVGVLQYEMLEVSRSASKSVAAQGTQRVSRPASGLITISNTFSTASQRLIANTRFQAADGKIYRIRDSVTVPGMSGSNAGTVTATIYADSPGPDYNKSSETTFTIPGFKGDPRYTKFSGKSTGSIAGGFIGEEPAVAASDLAAAKTELQKQLDSEARTAAAAEIPEGSVAIPGTLEIVFEDLVQAPGADKTATLTQTAKARGAVVRQGDLAAAIARKAVEDYQGEAVLFQDASKMDLSVATSSKTANTLTLALKGEATLVWQFDPAALRAALVGKSKSEFQSVVQAFQPAAAKADATIRPFWQGKFPQDSAKITIKTQVE